MIYKPIESLSVSMRLLSLMLNLMIETEWLLNRVRYGRRRYKWQPSPWSACHADEWRRSALPGGGGGGVCGGGVQMRRLTCLRLSDSRPVNSQLCRAVTLLPVVQQWVCLVFSLVLLLFFFVFFFLPIWFSSPSFGSYFSLSLSLSLLMSLFLLFIFVWRWCLFCFWNH